MAMRDNLNNLNNHGSLLLEIYPYRIIQGLFCRNCRPWLFRLLGLTFSKKLCSRRLERNVVGQPSKHQGCPMVDNYSNSHDQLSKFHINIIHRVLNT
jgi:hypothetical protein